MCEMRPESIRESESGPKSEIELALKKFLFSCLTRLRFVARLMDIYVFKTEKVG